MNTNKHLLTEEVAEQLRLSPTRIRALCRAGKLPFIRLGERKMGILQSDVGAFVRRNNTTNPAATEKPENRQVHFDNYAA